MMRALVLLILLWPASLFAQVPATLVADEVFVTGQSTLSARGNVEVFYDGLRLSAQAITYDRPSDRLSISGPIFITAPDGTILTADRASLDPRLENGMLLGARLVLNQQLQLAAARIDRFDGRFSQLTQTAVSSCAICGDRPPLWDIRAERIVHDADTGLLYLTNARFRVRGVPILPIPRLRLPDPSVDRATGLLRPRLRTTNRLGSGIKLPYFVTFGPSRDLLITPYVSRNTRTLELRYRQAFRDGDLSINAAVSDDDLAPDQPRSYIFADGTFALGGGYRLAFDIEATSDDAYLLDYGYSDKDRLDSAVTVTRITPTERFVAGFTYFQTLRDDELNRTLPPILADVRYDRRIALAGGTLTLGLSGDALIRYGTAQGDEGRDVTRVGAALSWDRTWITAPGVVATLHAGLRGDYYQVNDAVAFQRDIYRAVPTAALTLRYPLVKSTATAQHLLEPIFALSWSRSLGDTPPNEDSTRPEFDAANLLALSRFPGDDAVETGRRVAAGLAYTRIGRGGSYAALTLGRIWRDDDNPSFTVTSGQQAPASDWLLAGQVLLPQGLRIEARSLLDDALDPVLGEARVNWQTTDMTLGAGYIWQAADPDVARDDTVSEWSLDGRVQLNPAWAISFDTRYDLVADAPARAGLGVEWRNECVTIDLSVSRRYTSSTTVDPSTDYGLSVELAGFSAATSTGRPTARCTQ